MTGWGSLLACAALVCSCGFAPSQSEELRAAPGASAAQGSHAVEGDSAVHGFASAWNQYLSTFSRAELQDGCFPEWRRPETGTPGGVRGVVFLVHGFTACPQQYFEWAEALTAAGFEVVLPLMPGMGRKRPPGGRDMIDGLPADFQGRESYSAFAERVAALAAVHPAPVKVVGGLSVGGTVAADAASRFPEVFDRAFVVTPLVELADFKYRLALNVVEALRNLLVPLPDAVLGRMIGWGPGCEDEISRVPPRAGICDFRVDHALAVQSYGHQTLARIGPARIPVQILGVDDDPAANNGSIGRMARLFAKGPGKENTSACLYPAGVNHSMFSRFDSPDEDKFWIETLMEQATQFVVNARFFPQSRVRADARLPECRT